MSLSAIGISKLRERRREGLEEAEAQAEATAGVSVAVNGGRGGGGFGAQFGRPLLGDGTPHNNEGAPLLINVEAEPVRVNQDRPVEQSSLI